MRIEWAQVTTEWDRHGSGGCIFHLLIFSQSPLLQQQNSCFIFNQVGRLHFFNTHTLQPSPFLEKILLSVAISCRKHNRNTRRRRRRKSRRRRRRRWTSKNRKIPKARQQKKAVCAQPAVVLLRRRYQETVQWMRRRFGRWGFTAIFMFLEHFCVCWCLHFCDFLLRL